MIVETALKPLSIRAMKVMLQAFDGVLDYSKPMTHPSDEQHRALQVLQDRGLIQIIGAIVEPTNQGRLLVESWRALTAVDWVG